MATGRNMQLKKQIGEYLVAAELCRRNLISTTFTGNVPDFDIVAVTEEQKTIPIQVKAKGLTGDWQFDAKKFLDISISKGIQTVKGKSRLVNPDLIFVFVHLIEQKRDAFYICRIKDVQEIIYKKYSRYLEEHKGRKSKNPDSTHCTIKMKDLESYKDNWTMINDK